MVAMDERSGTAWLQSALESLTRAAVKRKPTHEELASLAAPAKLHPADVQAAESALSRARECFAARPLETTSTVTRADEAAGAEMVGALIEFRLERGSERTVAALRQVVREQGPLFRFGDVYAYDLLAGLLYWRCAGDEIGMRAKCSLFEEAIKLNRAGEEAHAAQDKASMLPMLLIDGESIPVHLDRLAQRLPWIAPAQATPGSTTKISPPASVSNGTLAPFAMGVPLSSLARHRSRVVDSDESDAEEGPLAPGSLSDGGYSEDEFHA